MTFSFNLILDVMIAALLVITILYCWALSRKLQMLHEGKKEFERFIQDFNLAVVRAEDNIQSLKSLSGETDDQLKQHIEKARFLANDLSFLMSKGESVADTLEQRIALSRQLERGGAHPKPAMGAPLAKARTQAPSDIMQRPSDQQFKRSLPAGGGAEPRQSSGESGLPQQSAARLAAKRTALEHLLNQIATRKSAAQGEAKQERKTELTAAKLLRVDS